MCHMMFEAGRGLHRARNAFGTVLEIKGRVVIGNWETEASGGDQRAKKRQDWPGVIRGRPTVSCMRAASLALNMESSLSGATGERMRSQQECEGLCEGS